MLDGLSDAIGGLFAGSGAPGRERPSAADEAVWMLAILVLPCACFALVAWAESEAAFLGLPVASTALVVLLSRWLGCAAGRTAVAAVCCLVLSFGAAFFGAVFSMF